MPTTINPSDQTITQYNIQTGGANNLLNNVAPSATSGVPVISQGASSQPIFGTAVVAGGGTGAVTLTGLLTGNGTSAITATAITQYNVITGGASNAPNSVAPGNTGIPLISQGAAAQPIFGTATVPGGGTGAVTLTGLVLGNGTSAMTAVTYVDVTSWTPNIQINSSSTGITYTTQTGYYVRMGSVVYAAFNILLSSKGASSGAVTISNLPVTVGGTSGSTLSLPISIFDQVTAVGYTTMGMYLTASTTVANFFISGSAVAAGNLVNTQISNTFRVFGVAIYFTT